MTTENGHGRRVRLGDGLRLYYREVGPSMAGGGKSVKPGENQRPPLLLLHGFSGSSDAWGDDLLRNVATSTGRRLIAVDLPGHGRSDDPGDPSRHALPEVVRMLVEFLGILGIPTAAWVGYSMGGRIALGAAVLRPDNVSGLILESSSPGLPTEEERSTRRASDEDIATRIEELGMEAFVDYWSGLPLFSTQRRLPGDVRDSIRRRRLENRPPALAACLRGMGSGSQPSFWEDLGGLTIPILILVGEQDAKFAEIGRRMVRGIPEAALIEVSGAGHTVHLEKPDEWTVALVNSLGCA